MVAGNVEKALDLCGVQVKGEHPVGSRRHEQVCDELGGDRHARLVLSVLAGVPEEREHGRDALCGGAAGGVYHYEQLHYALVGGLARGLYDEHVVAADVVDYFHEGFAVGKGFHDGVAYWHRQFFGRWTARGRGGLCR